MVWSASKQPKVLSSMMPSFINTHSNSMVASEVLFMSHPNCLERMVSTQECNSWPDTVRSGETKRILDACIEPGLEGSVVSKAGGELCWDGMLGGKVCFQYLKAP